MYLERESLFLRGVTEMASSASTYIGPSYVVTECYEKDGYEEEFKYVHGLKTNLKLELVNETFKEVLASLFGEDKKIIDGLLYLFSRYSDNFNKIYTINDKTVLEKIEKKVMFYFLEDIYFIEGDNIVFCLIMGNNE